jgi:hypothetical protein
VKETERKGEKKKKKERCGDAVRNMTYIKGKQQKCTA